jgi:hypothetical protein
MATYRVIAERDTTKLEVRKVEYSVSLSRTGGQGASNTNFGGLEFEFAEIGEGDLITVVDNKWTNVKRMTVTDGGNF